MCTVWADVGVESPQMHAVVRGLEIALQLASKKTEKVWVRCGRGRTIDGTHLHKVTCDHHGEANPRLCEKA